MLRWLVPPLGLFLTLAPPAARAQVNIDQGKAPGQIYAADCAVCHKSIRGLANGRGSGALAGFLTEHYTSSAKEAAALAAYVLASGGGVGIAAPPRAHPGPERAPGAAEEAKPRATGRDGRRAAKPEEKPAAAAKLEGPRGKRARDAERRASAEPGRATAGHGLKPSRREPGAARPTPEPDKPIEAAVPPAVAPAPEPPPAVAATPRPPEAPAPQADSGAVVPGPSAGAPAPAEPESGAPVPRDNIPD